MNSVAQWVPPPVFGFLLGKGNSLNSTFCMEIHWASELKASLGVFGDQIRERLRLRVFLSSALLSGLVPCHGQNALDWWGWS